MNNQTLQNERTEKDKFFKSHPQSPLTDQQKQSFAGLNYYPPNPELDLEVEVKPFAKKQDIQMQTTTGQTQWYRRYGEFVIRVNGEEARFTIYQASHGFFLPFVDAQAGKETYPAGRYLEPEQIDETSFYVDFNQAYNPYCAYNEQWSCPITPAENRVQVAIQAGEKIPTGEWVIQP